MTDGRQEGLPPTGLSARVDLRTPHDVSAMLALRARGWASGGLRLSRVVRAIW